MDKMKQIITILIVLCLVMLVSCKQTEDPNVIITEAGETTEDAVTGEDATDEVTIEDDAEDTGLDDDSEETELEDDETDEEDVDETDTEDEDETALEPSENQEIITISDITFKPKEMTIEPGTNILWIHNDKYNNQDSIVHVVRIYPMEPGMKFKSVQSERMSYGDKFNVTLDEPGKYYFIDIIFKNQMKGYITVTE